MSEIYSGYAFKEIKKYSEEYGLLEVINTKYKSFVEKHMSRFVILINDLIEKLTVKELNSSINLTDYKRNIIKVISILSDYIRAGDNLVDNFYVERTYENYKEFIRELATLTISSWNIQRYFKTLPIDGNKLVLKALFKIKEVVEIEGELREKPRKISEIQLIDFTEKKNSDFFLYYSFLTPFIKVEIDEIVLEFLKNYVILDNLLDDMTDIYSDYKSNNFNMLLLRLNILNKNLTPKDYGDLIRTLIENKVYDDIFNLFKKHYDLANTIISGFNNRFFEYLRFLLNGCLDGFSIFKKNNYFIDLLNDKSEKHKQICDLLLKPYPWTIISYNETFK